MINYTHAQPRTAKRCDWCNEVIPAGWAAFTDNRFYYHVSCAYKREQYFKARLDALGLIPNARVEIAGRTP